MRFNQYLTKLFCCTLSTLLVLSICLIGCSLTGCGNDDDDDDTASAGEGSTFDATTTLNDFANKVVLATYTDLDNKAGDLLTAVKALEGNTNQASLGQAQGRGRQRGNRGNRVRRSCSVPLIHKGSTQHSIAGPSIGLTLMECSLASRR